MPMEKIEKIKLTIEKVRKDCKELQEKGELTERGRGQLDIIDIITKILKRQ